MVCLESLSFKVQQNNCMDNHCIFLSGFIADSFPSCQYFQLLYISLLSSNDNIDWCYLLYSSFRGALQKKWLDFIYFLAFILLFVGGFHDLKVSLGKIRYQFRICTHIYYCAVRLYSDSFDYV